MGIRVLLVDDDTVRGFGLGELLENQRLNEVVGPCGDGEMAAKLTAELDPNVVLMDIAMPRMNAVNAIRQIMAASVGFKVLGLSTRIDHTLIRPIVKELKEAIQRVESDGLCVSSEFGDLPTRKHDGTHDDLSELTKREREVLRLLTDGGSSREIAEQLCISVKTVETHRSHIMSKLRLHSVAELTKLAIRSGLTSLDG